MNNHGGVIQLLPDSVANQIAAGEVVQRPGSVVKELLENAIDAGATAIKLMIIDAGKTTIQVIDNGCGMEMTDARLAFERHATSKINKADDLFNLHTFGFRGEALPSIAAVAEVELKTKRAEDKLGTSLVIRGGKTIKQSYVQSDQGCNITVKHLFFNIPVRRKFLKSDSVEFSCIYNEFERISLSHPSVAISLYNNNKVLHELPSSTLKQRIADLYGKKKELVPLSVKTELVSIEGFVGSPRNAKKRKGEQYFFVNNRFFRHAYFENAVCRAYEHLIPENHHPSFFLYLTIDANRIDVNIHPTKTEIKFEDEQLIWQCINAGVRESLGKAAFVPYLEFENVHNIPMGVAHTTKPIPFPDLSLTPGYNPFEEEKHADRKSSQLSAHTPEQHRSAPTLPFTSCYSPTPQTNKIFQLHSKYIVVVINNELLIVNQHRAHSRVLYEKLTGKKTRENTTLSNLNTSPIELTPQVYHLLLQNSELLHNLGIQISDCGNNQLQVTALPAEVTNINSESFLNEIANELELGSLNNLDDYKARIFKKLAAQMAIQNGKSLHIAEMTHLVEQLLASEQPDICPYGKKIFEILSLSSIDNLFHTPK